MDIETFSCIRSPECLPANHSPTLESRYSTNMVVDIQSHNPCNVPLDPSVHTSTHDYKMLPNDNPSADHTPSPHDYKLLPPEGVMTPSPDNPPKIDYPEIPKESSFVGESSPHPSPPNLSPETLESDQMENDCSPSTSPSQSPDKHRSRRKPTLEDIVRRMSRKVEDGSSYSEDSDDGEEDTFNGSLTIDMHAGEERMCGADEVDGAPPPRSMMAVEFNQNFTNGLDASELMDSDGLHTPKCFVNGHLPIINDENDVHPKLEEETSAENKKHSIPIDNQDNDATADRLAEISALANSITKSAEFPSTPKMNGNWFHGAFGSLPIFPFPQTPLEHHLAPNFLPFMEKFSSHQEVEKDYLKCQYCERTFRRQKNLENHIENTHQGKGPIRRKPNENGQNEMYFKCTHCPYTTKHQSNLYVHLRIHTGERPYICGACGVQYSQSHSLKSHIINKHDGIMSYYIKEKRNRSPRGMGYLQHVVPDVSVFKVSKSPTLAPPTSLHQSPQGQGHPNLLSHQHQQQTPLHLSSLIMPQPNFLHQQALMSPPNLPQLSPQLNNSSHLSPSQHSHHLAPHHIQQQQQHQQPLKSSPNCYMNGHTSPIFNHNNNILSKMSLQPNPDQPFPLISHHKAQMPLQEIRNNQMNCEVNFGAIDLSKKPPSKEILESTKTDADKFLKAMELSAVENNPCSNCCHASKLKMLRMNVVRMLSILVPNLNFEEKGISAEGDSVDELLHDVIESNMHDDDMNE